MAGVHEEGAVSRRTFLRHSAVAAGMLGACARWGHDIPPIAAAALASPPQPPPDELLVTIQSSSAVDPGPVTAALNSVLHPIGWTLRARRVGAGPQPLSAIVFQGRLPSGEPTTYTVLCYRNRNMDAPDHSAFLAAGTILTTANRQYVQRRLPTGATLASVTPNWVVAAAPGYFVEGGPGGLPSPDGACGNGWHFEFPALAPGSPLRPHPGKATVVVLDTAPSTTDLMQAAKRFGGNALLGRVVTQLTTPGHWHTVLGPAPVVPLAREVPCGSSTPYAPYLMPDHGLFVAGIVCDVAPACDLRIMRVLNQWGAAYLSDLLFGLAKLLRMPLKGPVVVNMSLTVRMPSISDLQAELANSPYPISALREEWRTLADACAPLGQILRPLVTGGVFLVAAAGNDSGGGPLPVDPCAPAALESALGVAAVNLAGARACYSNKGDAQAAEGDAVANGIAVLGGDLSGPVHGLYSAPRIYLPPTNSGPPNGGGWAQWMGTSFATPVIAGLAANYLAQDPAASPAAVMSQIQAAGLPTDPTLHAPTIQAKQVCA
jgi:hypothetical protein